MSKRSPGPCCRSWAARSFHRTLRRACPRVRRTRSDWDRRFPIRPGPTPGAVPAAAVAARPCPSQPLVPRLLLLAAIAARFSRRSRSRGLLLGGLGRERHCRFDLPFERRERSEQLRSRDRAGPIRRRARRRPRRQAHPRARAAATAWSELRLRQAVPRGLDGAGQIDLERNRGLRYRHHRSRRRCRLKSGDLPHWNDVALGGRCLPGDGIRRFVLRLLCGLAPCSSDRGQGRLEGRCGPDRAFIDLWCRRSRCLDCSRSLFDRLLDDCHRLDNRRSLDCRHCLDDRQLFDLQFRDRFRKHGWCGHLHDVNGRLGLDRFRVDSRQPRSCPQGLTSHQGQKAPPPHRSQQGRTSPRPASGRSVPLQRPGARSPGSRRQSRFRPGRTPVSSSTRGRSRRSARHAIESASGSGADHDTCPQEDPGRVRSASTLLQRSPAHSPRHAPCLRSSRLTTREASLLLRAPGTARSRRRTPSAHIPRAWEALASTGDAARTRGAVSSWAPGSARECAASARGHLPGRGPASTRRARHRRRVTSTATSGSDRGCGRRAQEVPRRLQRPAPDPQRDGPVSAWRAGLPHLDRRRWRGSVACLLSHYVRSMNKTSTTAATPKITSGACSTL